MVNPNTIKMRVWERLQRRDPGRGTGCLLRRWWRRGQRLCSKGSDITVRVRGGDLVVNYTDEKVTLTGDAKLVYTGEAEY